MSNDLCFVPARELVAGYRAGKLSPVDATGAVLDPGFAEMGESGLRTDLTAYLEAEAVRRALRTRVNVLRACRAFEGSTPFPRLKM